LQGWLGGDDLASLADRFLADIPNASWRIEQLVEAVTSHFEHYLSWTTAVLVELVNERLEGLEVETRLCPQLGSFTRYGVDSTEALALMVAGVRSRRLAHAIAKAARAEDTIADVRDWLRSMSLPEWRHRFAATATEILDLLDLTRTRRRSILRTLLETGSAEVAVQLEPVRQSGGAATETVGPEPSALDQPVIQTSDDSTERSIEVGLAEVADEPRPAPLGLYDSVGTLRALVPAGSHADLQALVDTGLATTIRLDSSAEPAVMRVTLSDVTVAASEGRPA
jgi:hypothetical protein